MSKPYDVLWYKNISNEWILNNREYIERTFHMIWMHVYNEFGKEEANSMNIESYANYKFMNKPHSFKHSISL